MARITWSAWVWRNSYAAYNTVSVHLFSTVDWVVNSMYYVVGTRSESGELNLYVSKDGGALVSATDAGTSPPRRTP